MDIGKLVVLALLIEAVVQAVKPIWNPEAKKLSVPELISMAVGAIVAVIGQVNIFDGLFVASSGVLLYVCYVLTGAALGRGPSFVHDLWVRVRTFNKDAAGDAAGVARTIADIIKGILNPTKENETT